MKKVYHVKPGGTDREVDSNAIDYGDGTVMVGYVDTGDIAIVLKSELVMREVAGNDE
jgi:hypothetical protein